MIAWRVVVYLVGMTCGLGWWFGCLFDVANYCFGYGFLLASLARCCVLWLFVFDCVCVGLVVVFVI